MAQTQERSSGGEASERKPLASFDTFLARAEQQAPAWVMMMMRLAPRSNGPVTVLIQEPTAPHIYARSQLALDRPTAKIIKWEPYAGASLGRKARTWARGLHIGEALGFAGQSVAGLASLGGCFLVWTGFAMAWQRFHYRNRQADRQPTGSLNGQDEIHPLLEPTGQITELSMEVARIAMEQTNFNAINGRAHNHSQDALRNWNAALYDEDSLLMLYGSVTGTAEMLANKLAAALRRAGHAVRVRDMAHCGPHVLTRRTTCYWSSARMATVNHRTMPCRSGNLSCAAMDYISGAKNFRSWRWATRRSTTFADVVGNSMQHWNATAQFVSIRASIATSITKRPPRDGLMVCWRIFKQTNRLYRHKRRRRAHVQSSLASHTPFRNHGSTKTAFVELNKANRA